MSAGLCFVGKKKTFFSSRVSSRSQHLERLNIILHYGISMLGAEPLLSVRVTVIFLHFIQTGGVCT